MLNKVILIGRLTREPRLEYTPKGLAVCALTMAVQRDYTNSAGEKEVDFIDITTFQHIAEICANYLQKGQLIAVEGSLRVNNWQDSNGKKRKSINVVAENVKFLDNPKRKNQQEQGNGYKDGHDGWDELGKEV